jgi:pimeloyl-ACP methyl ester carboxylesterase
MSITITDSNITAPTRFLKAGSETYAYRRFGGGAGLPLLCLQHFTGTLDNWDPAVTDPLAAGREVILFDNVGSRPINRLRVSDHRRHGGACTRIRGRPGSHQLRRARLLARWHGRSADGARTVRPSFDE